MSEMKQSRRSASNSSFSPSPSSSSTPSSSSLNSSTVESFQFSPWNSLSGNECMSLFSSKAGHSLPLFSPVSASEDRPADGDERVDPQDRCIYDLPGLEQESPCSFMAESHRARTRIDDGYITMAGEVSDAESSSSKPRHTLAELICSADKEELQCLLNSAPSERVSSPKPSKSLLVQALCRGTRSTSVAMVNPGSKIPPRPPSFNSTSPPRLQRSVVRTAPRTKCRAPSPLRNSSCCNGTTNQILDCTVVVRSRSSGPDVSRSRIPPDNPLTKSKSLGTATSQPRPSSKSLNRAGKSYSNGKHNLYEKCSSRNASRRSAVSSNDSIIAAMERYQKNSKAEQKRRSSYLPYKSVLLSLFPFSSLWSQLRGGHHQPHHSNVAY